MLNKETALRVDKNSLWGLGLPDLAWTLTKIEHLENSPPNQLVVHFWLGLRAQIRAFAQSMAHYYSYEYSDWPQPHEVLRSLSESEGVSILYWEGEELSLCAQFLTSPQLTDASLKLASEAQVFTDKENCFTRLDFCVAPYTNALQQFQTTTQLTQSQIQFLTELSK